MPTLNAAAAKNRDCAVRCLRRKLPYDPEDQLNQILVDPLADLVKAAVAQGFSRDAVIDAVRLGVFHGWTEARMANAIPELEGEASARDMLRALAARIEARHG